MTNQIQPVAADVTPTFTEFLASPEEKALEAKVYENLPTGELQQLIKSAQAGNQQALDKLCEQFRPVVEATARSESCYSVLKEDGLSIAWIVFIDLILTTKKKVTVRFPGYIKKALYTRLINELLKTVKSINSISLDDEELKLEQIPNVASFEDKTLKNHHLVVAMQKLNLKDRQLIYCHYFGDLSLTDYGKATHQSKSAIKMQHARALAKLHKILKNN